MSNVEINSKSKKVALLGFVIVLVLAVAVCSVGASVAGKGNLEACSNVAVAALKAQLMDLEIQPSAITLTVDKAYAKRSNEQIDLTGADESALKSVFGAGVTKKSTVTVKSKAIVYIEYTAVVTDTGEAIGGNKALVYVCKDDITYIVNNTTADGKTVISAKEPESRESLVQYQNSGLAKVSYLKLTSPEDKPREEFPTDLSEFTQIDSAGLTEYIRRKS